MILLYCTQTVVIVRETDAKRVKVLVVIFRHTPFMESYIRSSDSIFHPLLKEVNP